MTEYTAQIPDDEPLLDGVHEYRTRSAAVWTPIKGWERTSNTVGNLRNMGFLVRRPVTATPPAASTPEGEALAEFFRTPAGKWKGFHSV